MVPISILHETLIQQKLILIRFGKDFILVSLPSAWIALTLLLEMFSSQLIPRASLLTFPIHSLSLLKDSQLLKC